MLGDLASILIEQHRYDEALVFCERAIAANEMAWLNKGVIALDGDADARAAIGCFAEAVRLLPADDSAIAYMNMGIA